MNIFLKLVNGIQRLNMWNGVERGERRSEIGSGVRTARERSCRRRNLSPTVKEVYFCFFFVASHRTPCLNSGLEPSSNGGSSLGGKTRSRGSSWREKIGLHVQVVIPGDGGYHRSVDPGFSPGGGDSLSFAAGGSSSRKGEFGFGGSCVVALVVRMVVRVRMDEISVEDETLHRRRQRQEKESRGLESRA
ncbi:hypothetical protein F2Q69_00032703 [Brassica cretica]|uniref:Uncharacterized protein n=1 Tax=Brassica cretica TaxID=69181 RepID=A0A8S9STS6_BRACR|nr:hypothetical protein F2Q69_00032703 [Brassica cretica]